MKLHALAAASVLFFSAAHAAGPATPAIPDARGILQVLDAQGFVAIHELERREGLWTAEGTSLDGREVYLLIDADGRVVDAIGEYGEGGLSVEELSVLLSAQGYSALRDFEFDDGLWELEAVNAAGQRVELRVHGGDGRVLSERPYGAAPEGAGLLSADEVSARLIALGYSDLRGLSFDDGQWELYARHPQGYWVELYVDARTGEIVREWREDGPPNAGGGDYLSAEEVTARLAALGYTQIRPIRIDDGLWEVYARNPRGQRVELYVDARTGVIVREERD